MRTIPTALVQETVRRLCREANYSLPGGVCQRIAAAAEQESAPLAKHVLQQLEQNAAIAASEHIPLCQDTGMVLVFLDIGQDVHFTGGQLNEAVEAGVRQAYQEEYFRASIVADPLLRSNTGDNTPAVIYPQIVPGEQVYLQVMPKGFGSENMSAAAMLKPADGRAGVLQFITKVVKQAGGNPCPPIFVGVGLGGTMEKAALLSKQALLRPMGTAHPAEHMRELEEEALIRINRLGIGAQGFGGAITALAVHVESYPTHIAGLPCAVTISCHVARHCSARL